MNLEKIIDYLKARIPLEQVPITWDSTGYTSEAFNRWAASPTFSGWEGDKPPEEEAGIIVKLLKVQSGDTLLDVCCGYGRHALLLTEQYNLKVAGVDISPGLITTARRFAREKGLDIDYEVRHAAELPWTDKFDAAIITYNSFSLFSHEDALCVLQGIYRALHPGGRLFLDLDNKLFNCRYGIRNTNWYQWPHNLTLQEIYFHEDISLEVNRDLCFGRDSEEIDEFIIFKRIYTLDEIRELLEQGAFRVDRVYGDWDLSPLVETSPKMLLSVIKE